MVVLILKIYMFIVMAVMTIYFIRHYIFSMNRTYGEQRFYYQDIIDSELPYITVFVPMHDEEKVARQILDALVNSDYPREKLEIIPINDHSRDATQAILDEYGALYPCVRPFYRCSGKRGKQNALNDALLIANGDIVLVFDADYIPPRGALRDIAVCFKDPEVGAVMGRVIPMNTSKNLLARIIDLERSGGYQIDQQARHNLKLIPQYGGTVGGFRKDIVLSFGGFDPRIITEDTELTFRLFVKGWKIAYANRVECYEEAPEDWVTRARQIRRWSRGHSQVLYKYLFPLLKSKYLTFWEKVDGVLLLAIFAVPAILFFGMVDAMALFFLGEMTLVAGTIPIILIISYNAFGNFAPFYQIGTAAFLDGSMERTRLLPFLMFNFLFSLWHITLGFFDSLLDWITNRRVVWHKTKRFRKEET